MFFALCSAGQNACMKSSKSLLFARSDVEKLIAPFTTFLQNSFEVILVARRRNGQVIFQQSAEPGMEVINVSSLSAARSAPAIDLKALSEAATWSEVSLAGTNYTR